MTRADREPRYDLAIVGGGIVGLAVARETATRFPRARLILLEKEAALASHQTGRNSGVIHSGIYYRPGSLKAAACVEGAAAMIDFCRREGIPHQVCGKVVVAVEPGELPALEDLRRRGEANGVRGLALMDPGELREFEPHATGISAMRVPGTAVTDFAAVARRFAEIGAAAGARILTGARVTALRPFAEGIEIVTTAGEFIARHLVNCAGLHSDRVARMAGARPDVRIVPFRGEYHLVADRSRHLVRALIYPVPRPELPFLGVHFTRGVDGRVEAGPNAVWAFAREGYRRWDINPLDMYDAITFAGFWRMARRQWRYGAGEYRRSFSRRAFVRALRRLVPELADDDLAPGGSGVRAQALDAGGALVDDFHIVRTEKMIHVLNVPSPAATASIAIARRIVEMMAGAFELGRPEWTAPPPRA